MATWCTCPRYRPVLVDARAFCSTGPSCRNRDALILLSVRRRMAGSVHTRRSLEQLGREFEPMAQSTAIAPLGLCGMQWRRVHAAHLVSRGTYGAPRSHGDPHRPGRIAADVTASPAGFRGCHRLLSVARCSGKGRNEGGQHAVTSSSLIPNPCPSTKPRAEAVFCGDAGSACAEGKRAVDGL